MIGRALLRNSRGASAAEFGMVLPLLMILLFAIIDGARFMWEYNRAEKATQVGARYAAVTRPVASGITDANFVGVTCSTAMAPGDRICAEALPEIACNNSTCTCTGCPAGVPGTYDSTAFANIVAQIKRFEPDVKPANVQVLYRGSGLGYAGDPTGADVSPLVTIKLTNLQFRPITTFLTLTLSKPSFTTTLTAEDLAGHVSN